MNMTKIGILSGCLLMVLSGCRSGPPAPEPVDEAREAARRHVNLGVAYLAQFLPGKATEEFTAALEEDPDNLAATVNLGITYRVTSNLPESRRWLEAALALDPESVVAYYNLALVDRLSGDPEGAIKHLEKVVELDSRDAEAFYNLGLSYSQLQQHEAALESFNAALERNSRHASALYARGRALLALGREEEALEVLQASQALSGGRLATTSGQQYGEQGIHSMAVEDMPVDPTAREVTVAVSYVDATAASGIDFRHGGGPRRGDLEQVGSGIAVLDFDGDGHLDLYFVNAAGGPESAEGINRLYRNRGDATFEDVTESSGTGDPGVGTGVSVGDYDNDGQPDLYVGNWGANRLYRNQGDGTFRDTTEEAGVGHPGQAMAVAFVDMDHDGDLDLVNVDGGDGSAVSYFRNDGDGTFTDRTVEAGFSLPGPATGLLALDIDLDRDVDLVATTPEGILLFLSQRGETFQESAEAWGLGGKPGHRGVIALDLRKDGPFDLAMTGESGAGPLSLFLNEGTAFRQELPGAGNEDGISTYGLTRLDYDLDGFADLAVAVDGELGPGVRLFRNLGQGRFGEVTGSVGLDGVSGGAGRALQAADLDGDGDPDLILGRAGQKPLLLRNEQEPTQTWIAVDLEGLHSNRTGVGARVAVRAGALWSQTYVSASGGYLGSGPARPIFGLGPAGVVDAVSVLWPGGVLQDELEIRPNGATHIKELDRKGSSCPAVFGWDGQRFAFLTDLVGGGGLGLFMAPGMYYIPDPDELYLVRPEVGLQPDADGRLRMRVVENLEEVTYLDRFALQAADHPEGTFVVPMEGMRPMPPYPEARVLLMDRLLQPVRAVDGEGVDWTAELLEIDRTYPGFVNLERQGYAELHDLIVTFPAPPAGAPVWLWAQGTMEYSNSTPHYATSQHGGGVVWPSLEVRSPDGSYRTLEPAMPAPMGMDKAVLVDLSGRLPVGTVTLRIRTSMEIYWDRLSLALESGKTDSLRVTEIQPDLAELRPFGFPLWTSEDGKLPRTFVYEEARLLDTWKRMPGRYTRHGPVNELLRAADDRLVVMSEGDEIALEFDTGRLPALLPGQSRTWLIYGFGYIKDTDLHTLTSGRVEPLPYAAMGGYPPDPGAYHADPERAEADARFNTRVIPTDDPLRRWPSGSAVDLP